jgi:hypothetical protein
VSYNPGYQNLMKELKPSTRQRFVTIAFDFPPRELIDRQGSTYLPQMFGPHGYRMLWDITQLPQRLPELYRRLTTVHH